MDKLLKSNKKRAIEIVLINMHDFESIWIYLFIGLNTYEKYSIHI
jgi:hypothetical protein